MILRDDQDAFGYLLMDYYQSRKTHGEVIERDDGHIGVASGAGDYFKPHGEWSSWTKEAISLAQGRILDVGCGAGRVALYLQKKGHRVVAMDYSPLAVKVCRLRGIKDVRLMTITQVSHKLGIFDTIIMCGNNLGLLENPARGKGLLRKLYSLTADDGILLGQTLDPYKTTVPEHLAYHKLNRSRGRMPGQVRIRVRYGIRKTPWFDYLFMSKDELRDLISGTGWGVRKFIDGESGVYWAILGKEKNLKLH